MRIASEDFTIVAVFVVIGVIALGMSLVHSSNLRMCAASCLHGGYDFSMSKGCVCAEQTREDRHE